MNVQQVKDAMEKGDAVLVDIRDPRDVPIGLGQFARFIRAKLASGAFDSVAHLASTV